MAVTASFQWISIANLILNGMAMAGVLILVWIGWLRTRRLAFLVLAAWSLSVMFGLGLQSFWPFVTQLFGGGGAQMRYELLMWAQLFRSLLSTVLLITGLGLFVFGGPDLRKREAR